VGGRRRTPGRMEVHRSNPWQDGGGEAARSPTARAGALLQPGGSLSLPPRRAALPELLETQRAAAQRPGQPPPTPTRAAAHVVEQEPQQEEHGRAAAAALVERALAVEPAVRGGRQPRGRQRADAHEPPRWLHPGWLGAPGQIACARAPLVATIAPGRQSAALAGAQRPPTRTRGRGSGRRR
jgi:hypothetical protein